MDEHQEEVEHIPWGELLAATDDGRRRAIYLVAGALTALVLGIVITRAVSSPSSTPIETIAVAAETTVAPTTPSAATTLPTLPAESTTTTSTLPAPILYAEADLMAFPPDLAARAAVARAEWFVTDYFTADLEPNGTAGIRGALPSGVELPELPHDAAAGLSYVEWARAFRVEESGDGSYRIGVAYRLLGAPPERGFQRLPVRAVEVRVAVGDSGGSVVLDLPTPIALPVGPTPEAWPTIGEIPPQAVVDGAMGSAAAWGSEHRLLGTFRVAGGWRVMLSAADELGNRWPLVVHVDESGSPI